MSGTLDTTMMGLVPSAAIPGSYFGRMGSAPPLQQQGSSAGLPGVNAIVSSAGVGGTDTAAQSAIAAGQAATRRPVMQQPIMWLIILMVVSVVMFAHLANVEVHG